MKVEWREDDEEKSGKTKNAAKQIISLAIRTRTRADDDDDLGVCVFLNSLDALREGIAGGLIEMCAAHICWGISLRIFQTFIRETS